MATQCARHGELACFFCLCCCALLLLPMLLKVQGMVRWLTANPTSVLPPLAISLPLPLPPVCALLRTSAPLHKHAQRSQATPITAQRWPRAPPSTQLLNIETTKSQAQLFAALKEGNTAMKEIQQVGRSHAGLWLCVSSMQHCIDAHAEHAAAQAAQGLCRPLQACCSTVLGIPPAATRPCRHIPFCCNPCRHVPFSLL